MKVAEILKYRMLCYSDHFSLLCRGLTLYYKTMDSCKIVEIGKLPSDILKSILSRIRFISRLARIEPRCGIFLDDNTALVSCHGSIYNVDLKQKRITEEHKYRNGMNNPLSFSKINNLNGFEDSILYGDYINDGKKNEISIYSRPLNSACWKIVYTFQKGRIKHIHALIPCKQRNSILILTGDNNEESGIWEAEENFGKIRRIIGGKQQFRACVALPLAEGILFATDAPDEDNAVWYCDYEGSEVKKVYDLAGPCIYGVRLSDDNMLISSSVEPRSNDESLISWITYKTGDGVHDKDSHVYLIDKDRTVTEIYKSRKDILPMRLFGYGTFLFPSGTGRDIYITGQSLTKCDGKTIKLVR